MDNRLYLLESHLKGFDRYTSAVVVAPDEDAARKIHPARDRFWGPEGWYFTTISGTRVYQNKGWVPPEEVQVTFLGLADKALAVGVICADYNAG